jgi:hypothetical protein
LGSYAVEITINGCSYISNCIDISIIGVEERIAPELLIYPNPANDWLYVTGISDVKSIAVEDMTGKIVYYSGSMQNAAPVIAVDQFASGVYMVHVTTQTGHEKNALFIKK